MSIQDDTVSAMKAIEIGALLFIKTPTTLEMLRCLWQHVAREKARAVRERERPMANYDMPRDIEFGEMARHYPHENPNDVVGGSNLFMMEKQLRRSYYNGKRVEEDYDSDSELNFNNHGKVKRKICTEWTQELHEKFIEAVKQLGEGKCFPKEILELMNVPGLTRMQVASHLQKCRNDNWRSLRERKSTLGMHPSDLNGGPNHKQRWFGSMPRISKALSDHEAYGRGEQGLRSYTESEIGTRNTTIDETSMVNQITYHQDYGALVPHANNNVPYINSSNLRHLSSADGLFTSDTDCMIPNFCDPPQEFEGMNHPQLSSRAFPSFDSAVYVHDQTNSKGMSMDSTSQWTGSETSNFCSEDSHTNQNP